MSNPIHPVKSTYRVLRRRQLALQIVLAKIQTLVLPSKSSPLSITATASRDVLYNDNCRSIMTFFYFASDSSIFIAF